LGFSCFVKKLRLCTAAEQVASHLRAELVAGAWRGQMPGVLSLAAELGVNHKTVEAALKLLTTEGVLVNQGAGKSRQIPVMEKESHRPSLRIGILMHESADLRTDCMVEIWHQLIESGHTPFVAKQSLTSLGMEKEKVADYVAGNPADGWLLLSAPRGVIEWFSKQALPFFGLFAQIRRLQYASAGPEKTPAYIEVVRKLIGYGHRRIVLLARSLHRHPVPGHSQRHFLRVMSAAGIEVSDYHFPFWEDTKEGFHSCLEGLFHATPPTALLVEDPILFGAVQQFLAERGMRVPGDISLVCADPDPTFVWRNPKVAHIRWDSAPCVKRVVMWANHVASGKEDRIRLLTPAKFVDGGTIGPAKG
jgi:DNA-binding LacI/PurR family transcriptional regulator